VPQHRSHLGRRPRPDDQAGRALPTTGPVARVSGDNFRVDQHVGGPNDRDKGLDELVHQPSMLHQPEEPDFANRDL
jgi:hypothetical protein